jgi:prepilin-type N-terminal cleavage/methylation domain-containing protein
MNDHRLRRQDGFTLVEMLVVVLMIGILARVAVPQYFKVVEKSKAREASNFFLAMQASQDRYHAKYGAYCMGAPAGCAGLDVGINPLHYFNPGFTFTAGGAGGWKMTLIRTNAPALYGNYQLTYDFEPASGGTLTCDVGACTTDLLPQLISKN